MMTFDKAVSKAKKVHEEFNEMQEYKNAWYFYVNDGESYVGGIQSGIVILKTTGSFIYPQEYFLSGKYDVTEIGEPKKL